MKYPKAATSILFVFFILFSSIKSIAQLPDSLNDKLKDSLSQSVKTDSEIAMINEPLKLVVNTGKSHPGPVVKNFLSARSLAVPVIFIGYGFTSLGHNELHQLNLKISEEVVEDAPKFKTRTDDYLKYAPAAGVYALDAMGIKSKHGVVDRTIVLAMSTILTAQLVTALKHGTHQLRPDGSTYNSFPSGHTTTAFIGAELMNQEYGSRSPWYSIAGYTVAAATGTMRIMNNRHWLGDVIAGAGLGILSTKFSYWIYYKIKPRVTRQKTIY